MPLSYDPEYFEACKGYIDAMAAAPKPALHDVDVRRVGVATVFGSLLSQIPDIADVEHSKHSIKSYDGETITVHRFSKKASTSQPGPAIVHYHGGGMIALDVEFFRKALALQVQQSGVQVFSVDYRLAPEHPDPAPVEDCYAGLVWLVDHAKDFDVDPARIAVMGESAGGGLAAGAALLARDRKLSPPLAKQILIYPMLDDRNTVPNKGIEPFATWNCNDNITGWTALLGDKVGKEDVSHYAAPARVASVEGLPATYMDVGELDMFRDEDIKYASRLAGANISVDFHLYPGVPHAFEIFSAEPSVTKRCLENRLRAMTSF